MIEQENLEELDRRLEDYAIANGDDEKVVRQTPKRLLTVEEVAVIVGTSASTLNYWYRFKKENPENVWAQMLPPFKQFGPRQTRYWDYSDIWQISEFKKALPKGRGGILGDTTQKYWRKRQQKKKEAQKNAQNAAKHDE